MLLYASIAKHGCIVIGILCICFRMLRFRVEVSIHYAVNMIEMWKGLDLSYEVLGVYVQYVRIFVCLYRLFFYM
jgi:hypothetical protein